jgi:hypothetical protein
LSRHDIAVSGTFQAFLSPLLGDGFYDAFMAISGTLRGFVARPHRVYILVTSEHGAAVALETVGPLAAGEAVELVVLVPHVVPYGIDLAGADTT